MERKGAIQMSLGLIIAVIFAVVFLSLAVTWVSDFMSKINILSNDLIDKGSQEIDDVFARTTQRFAIYPKEFTMERGQNLKMVAGVINKEEDSDDHMFVINVITTDNPNGENTADWINPSEFNTPLRAGFNQDLKFPITITPPQNAKAGTYVFYVVACIGDKGDSSLTCTGTTDPNSFQSTQYFRLTLK